MWQSWYEMGARLDSIRNSTCGNPGTFLEMRLCGRAVVALLAAGHRPGEGALPHAVDPKGVARACEHQNFVKIVKVCLYLAEAGS